MKKIGIIGVVSVITIFSLVGCNSADLSSISSKAAEELPVVMEKASEAAGEVASKASEELPVVMEKASEAADEVASKASEELPVVMEKASEALEDAVDSVEEVTESIQSIDDGETAIAESTVPKDTADKVESIDELDDSWVPTSTSMEFTISLQANASTGCSWWYEVEDPDFIVEVSSDYIDGNSVGMSGSNDTLNTITDTLTSLSGNAGSATGGVGVHDEVVGRGGTQVYVFKAIKKGTTLMYFSYGHDWNKDTDVYETKTYQIDSTGDKVVCTEI